MENSYQPWVCDDVNICRRCIDGESWLQTSLAWSAFLDHCKFTVEKLENKRRQAALGINRCNTGNAPGRSPRFQRGSVLAEPRDRKKRGRSSYDTQRFLFSAGVRELVQGEGEMGQISSFLWLKGMRLDQVGKHAWGRHLALSTLPYVALYLPWRTVVLPVDVGHATVTTSLARFSRFSVALCPRFVWCRFLSVL